MTIHERSINEQIETRSRTDHDDRSRRIDRRTFLRGVGVAMALPWLESIPVWGGEPTAGGRAARLAQAVRRPVHGQRHQPEPLVGEGRRRRTWS